MEELEQITKKLNDLEIRLNTHKHEGFDLTTSIDKYVSGTYTPTLTGVANIEDSTPYEWQYIVFGDVVLVSGALDVNTTSTGTTQLGASLPQASGFTSAKDCSGVFAMGAGSNAHHGIVLGDTTNDRAEITFTAINTSNQNCSVMFTYKIL
jgi:hypothetical protein